MLSGADAVAPGQGLKILLAQSSALHKHLCPRQVLGVRMGLCAAEILSFSVPQQGKRLLVFVETDGCFADGVSIATGCSLGHRTMRLADYGKVAATFVDRRNGRALRLVPSPDSRLRAVAAVPAAANRWQAQLEAYQTLPAGELLRVRRVKLNLDLEALMGKPGRRVTCCACGEEILNQRETVRDGQTLCSSCAGESYWTPLD